MNENKIIKEIITKTAKKYNIEIDRIILFGSRARGDFKKDSDWDILIVTKEKLDRKMKVDFWYEIYKNIEVPVDIIIASKESFEKYKKSGGFVYVHAVREGKVI